MKFDIQITSFVAWIKKRVDLNFMYNKELGNFIIFSSNLLSIGVWVVLYWCGVKKDLVRKNITST